MNGEEAKNATWDQCKMYVLEELKRMNGLLTTIGGKVDSLFIKVAGIAAVVGILVTIIVNVVLRGMVK
jgi:hypothetical protein